MTKEEIFQRLLELPAPVQDYIFSEEAGGLNGQIVGRNGLNKEQADVLLALLDELLLQDLRVDNLVIEIQRRLSLDSVKAKSLALDIAGYRLLPLDKFLGDIDGYIRMLGGDSKNYPDTRIKVEERTPDEAAAEVVGTSANAFDFRMKERLNDIIDSFYRGVRTDKQVMEMLKKPVKTGGMELSDEAASRLMDQIREEAKAVHIREKAEAAALAPPEEPVSAETLTAEAILSTPASPTPKKLDDFVTIGPEDEKEIADLKSAVLPARGAERAAETAAKIEASVEELYQASGLQPADETMQKRFKTVIGNRLRDVRDSMETLETLVQPKELGGMGLSEENARKVLSLIEEKLKQVHAAHAAEVDAKKSQWLKAEQEKQAAAAAAEKAKEEADLNGLYQAVVSKSKKAEAMSAAAAAPATPTVSPSMNPPLKGEVPKAEGSVPPAAPVLSAPPANLPIAAPAPARAQMPSAQPMQKMPAPPTMPKPPAAPPPPMTIVRPIQVPPPLPATPGPGVVVRPKMEDVKFVSKLTGPVEELRATTLVDFRRLSKDPKEAILKVRDKIDLLAEQSYSKRTEGIKAWMDSEVNRTYLEMMREALDGAPMPQVIAGRQTSKKPYLNPEELQAVAELSRNLRY